MAPLVYIGSRQILLLSVLSFLVVISVSSFSASSEPPKELFSRRRMFLELDEDSSSYEQLPSKKKSTKNQTKPSTKINNLVSSKNQTKTIKSNNNHLSTKNQTKLTDTNYLKKLNSTTLNLKSSNKKLNSTSKPSKSLLDPVKSATAKNKTTKSTATKDKKDNQSINAYHHQIEPEKTNKRAAGAINKKQQSPPTTTSFEQQEEFDGDDLIFSEFKDLPVKFQQTLLPDLERISVTSRAYITKANKEITKGFKPYVGNKYAPTIATLLSCAFVLIPLLLVSLLFNRIKAYFSLQKLLIFIQAYLSIYFSILCLSSVLTGLEPLRFFYATSQTTYVCLQVLQTLAYMLYLLLLLMYLVLVFSTECGAGSRVLGLAQTFVGFSVGLHYYMTVFHRVVLRQAPRTSWMVHGIYATCFFVICLVARVDRRKQTYVEEGGEEGKKN